MEGLSETLANFIPIMVGFGIKNFKHLDCKSVKYAKKSELEYPKWASLIGVHGFFIKEGTSSIDMTQNIWS